MAISTHVKKQQNKEENNNNNNNNVNMNNNENSLASKVLKFEDAKKFWTEHFGEVIISYDIIKVLIIIFNRHLVYLGNDSSKFES